MRGDAHRTLIASAAAAGFNTVRVWGGGIFLPREWYDACDEHGLMVYHDLMYPGHKEHAPANTTDQQDETRHQVRRLSPHPSIVIWDGENSDDGGRAAGVLANLSMSWVAEEDQSRALWPACQAAGWLRGVDTQTKAPLLPLEPLVPRLPVAHGGPGGFGTRMEYHGPYQHSRGIETVNSQMAGGATDMTITPLTPINVSRTETGVKLDSSFISEFGCTGMSSFESMSATLRREHWSVRGGTAEAKCSEGLPNAGRRCEGANPMSQRNYPCDSLITTYFGTTQEELSEVGELPFKRQLWLCMAAQALTVKGQVEQYRGRNIFGLLTWQLNVRALARHRLPRSSLVVTLLLLVRRRYGQQASFSSFSP